MKKKCNLLRNQATRWLPVLITSLWWVPVDLVRGLILALTIVIALISRDDA
jgi:hypothetical protein